MTRGSDKKAGNKKKGKGLISRGIVNQLEQFPNPPDDLSDVKGDGEEEMEKSPRTEKTNEPPQPDDPPPHAKEMPNIEPCHKRRKVTTLILTDEQELELVRWYQTLTIFYNQRLKEFKLRDMKDRLMSEKATELGITLVDLKTWLNSMRTSYGRLARQDKSGECTKLTSHQIRSWSTSTSSLLTWS